MDEHAGVARKWRDIARNMISPQFRLLDPMRRNFRDREVDSSNEIVEFDLQDIRDADIILVNYAKPSIGTSMEVFYASHDLGKFVVAFSPFSFKDSSPWMIRYCTKILPNLEQACQYVQTHFAERK
jgi:nucleoside 2-deoxyribosyltransferase